jgi:hypothetical protein
MYSWPLILGRKVSESLDARGLSLQAGVFFGTYLLFIFPESYIIARYWIMRFGFGLTVYHRLIDFL